MILIIETLTALHNVTVTLALPALVVCALFIAAMVIVCALKRESEHVK